MMIVKRTDNVGNWLVWHSSLNQQSGHLVLEGTPAAATNIEYWNNTAPTSTRFSVGPITGTNGNGATYVAYLFANNAGGFGLSGADSIVSCGSLYATAITTNTVNLGWEPQLVLVKCSSTTSDWFVWDNMRPFRSGGTIDDYQYNSYLNPNLSAAETNYVSATHLVGPTQTGFSLWPNQTGTYIYLAIRRGPMKTPTDATKVFYPWTGSTTQPQTINAGFPPDTVIARNNVSAVGNNFFVDRLRGALFGSQQLIYSNSTAAETLSSGRAALSNTSIGWVVDQTNVGQYLGLGLRRAAGFFDVVCYTGTGSARTISHNLGVVPEMMIVKGRSSSSSWWVYNAALGGLKDLRLNTTDAFGFNFVWNDTNPSASSFSINTNYVNASGATYVAYLFASCPGVSKVGSYTGTGTTNQINCGFTNGARFVLIKRTDSTGDWYVWDSARGIIAGNDPYLFMNSDAVNVTNTDFIDPFSAGFELSSTAPAALNANGGTYIFLAIA
jgi:hypothetical protein